MFLMKTKNNVSAVSVLLLTCPPVFFSWPGLRAGLAASIAGSSIINKMLLANIDPFGATPFIDPDPDSV